MNDDFFTNLHQKVNNGELTQKQAAKEACMRESKLIEIWKNLDLFPKKRGRQVQEIPDETKKRVLQYNDTFPVGYQRCYQGLRKRLCSVSEWQTRVVYESEGLFKYEHEYKPHCDDRIRYVAHMPNQLWHTDLHIFQENEQQLYLIAFLDDRTRFILDYSVLQTKEMINTAQALVNCIQKNHTKPSMIVIDNGTEFIGEEFQNVLQHYGIGQWRTRPYTPQQNGKIERYWQTLESSRKKEKSLILQLPALINEYNTIWHHSSLSKLYGQPLTPLEAWSKYPHWEAGCDNTIEYIK